MGRTLKTINQIMQQEEQAFANFRRSLRRSDQLIFDELFAGAKKHIAAGRRIFSAGGILM